MTVPDDVDLDDPASYRRLDPNDMFRRVDDLPEQIERAWEIAGGARIPDSYRSATNVVITGMGGSAIGGSLLQSYGSDQIPVPVEVWRGYGLPAYVSDRTLVIAVSYSGNTEETLSAMDAARARGAKLLAITTGGAVHDRAEEWAIPVIQFSYDAQPRATLGYLLTPLIRVFEQLGFLSPQDEAIGQAIAVARQCRQDWGGDASASRNGAKDLAIALRGRGVVVYGGDFLASVARRWKTQLNENAKTWAFYEEFPELDHNAIVGYECPPEMVDVVSVVVLHSRDLPDRILRRMAVTEQVMDRYSVRWRHVEARGSGRLAEMISLISLGDYVSYYLALLNGVDPTTIAPINFLKGELAKG